MVTDRLKYLHGLVTFWGGGGGDFKNCLSFGEEEEGREKMPLNF